MTQIWNEYKYTGPVLYPFILYSFDSPTQFNKIPDTPHSCLGGDHWCLLWCLDASVIDKINTLGPRQNGRYFTDDTFKYIFLNETIRISINISLKCVLRVPINNIPALVQIMTLRRPGDKPLPEPMMVSLLTHICVTRPQWVKRLLAIPGVIYKTI